MTKIKFIVVLAVGMMVLGSSRSKKSTDNVQDEISTNRDSNRSERSGQKPEFTDLLKQMAVNGDGLINTIEAIRPLKDQFSQIDTNSDGQISADEFKNTPKPERRKGQ